MRDLIVVAIVLGSLPLCFARPWIGVLVWCWLGYMNPHRFTWGFANTLPFSMMVGGATLAGLVFDRERKALPLKAPVLLLGLLWLTFLLSTKLAAINPEVASEQLSVISKILLMTFLTLSLFQDRHKLTLLVWVTALSVGFHGIKAGFWALTGVQQRIVGPPGTFLADNNDLALALNMILPLLVFLRRQESRTWARRGLLAAFLLCILSVLMTYSRGGFLGLCVTLAVIHVHGRSKIIPVLVAIVLVPLVFSHLPDQWLSRMETIGEYEKDTSANARLTAWTVALAIVGEHPLLGAGFKPFTEEMYRRHAPGYEGVHDAHSIIFQMMAENGLIGLVLFLALIATTFISLRRSRLLARGEPERGWINDLAEVLQASLLAYLVSGLFLGRAYFDLFYGLIAMAVLLECLVRAEAQARAAAEHVHAPRPGRPVARRNEGIAAVVPGAGATSPNRLVADHAGARARVPAP